jgi:AFG3 family protein
MWPYDDKIQVTYAEDSKSGIISFLIQFILPIIFIIAIWVLLMRKMGGGPVVAGPGGIFNIGKSKAQLYDKGTKVNITFNDVAGLDEAKVEVMEIVDFLKHPKKVHRIRGQNSQRLFVGRPSGYR